MKNKFAIKRLSIMLALILTLGMFYTAKDTKAFSINKNDITTNVMLVSDDANERVDSTEIKANFKQDDFIKKNQVMNIGVSKLDKNVFFNKSFKSDNIDLTIADNQDAIFFNFKLIYNENIVSLAQKELEKGKVIYFYGNNIDKSYFAKLFNLTNSIQDFTKAQTAKNSISTTQNATDNSSLAFIGVEKHSWGNSLITCTGNEFNFYQTLDFMIKDSSYSKEHKYDNPYFKNEVQGSLPVKSNLFGNLFGTQNAYAGSDLGTPLNYQRKSTYFNSNNWYTITDLYLNRFADSDPTYDSMTLEATTEFDTNSSNPSCGFFTKFQPYYANDTVHEGTPGNQSAVTSVGLNLGWPVSLSVYYNPNCSVDTSSSISLSSNYFQCYYYKSGYSGGYSFPNATIHKTVLAFNNYAPTSDPTKYVDILVLQNGLSGGTTWYTGLNNYYYYSYN